MDNAPAGTPNKEEISNWPTLCNVQTLDISKIVKPIALKIVSCLCCSIKAFCDMIQRIIKAIAIEKPTIMKIIEFVASKILCKSFDKEEVNTVKL